MDGDGRGDAASVEARDRLPAAARPGGEAASVDDHDDSDFDRVSVVSGASEWSDSASVRSGYTGLSGVSDADHRYADAGAVVRREAREAAGRAGYPDRERRGVTRERDDDGASVSDASSDLSTSDDEFAARRLLQGRIPPRKARDRSLAMRLGDAAVRSHAMASEADAMRDDRVSLGGGRDEAGATFRRDGPSRRSDGGSREDDDVQTRADRGGSARPVLGTLNRVTLVEACATGDVRIAKHTLERLRRETTSFSSRHPPPSDTKQNVENFFDVDALDFDGRAALHAAVELGDARGFDIVRFLCENAGADVEVKGAMGIRPLHVAAYCGAARCVAYLLSRGARPNLGDDDGAAALHWAASSGKSLCVSALLRADDVDPDVVNDKGALAEDLVDENDVATRDAFAFANEAFQPHALARDGRLATLRRALSEKFDVARVAEDAPRARRARRGLATLSIDSGKRFSPPPSVFKTTKDFGIERANTPERRPARLARRAPIAVDATAPDGSGETMVHRAARNGHADVVRVLVCEFGADLDVRCARIGATATHVAAENGHVDVLRVVRAVSGFPRFWRRRAEARTESSSSPTPLRKTTTTTLNDVRVVTQSCSSGGKTPLHLAARNGHVAACAFLVQEMRCDVDARDDDGQTAAHVAASSGRLETLRLLRANDADLDARDRDGRTPLHVAASGAFANAGPVARAFFVDEEVDEDARARRLLARDERGDAPAHLAFAAGAEVETALSLLPEEFFLEKTTTRAEVETSNERIPRRKDSFRGCGGWTCLHFAARGGYLHLVDALTRLDDVDVAAKDDAGATALHVAAETGVVAVLESLLAAAAERDREPEEPEARLRSKTNVSASEDSTSDGADASGVARLSGARLSGAAALARTRTNAGKTALHVACRAGNAASARAVLALCPETLDARDASGATALHFASARADRGGGACASLLLRHGCVMTARTHSDGAEPLHVASARGASLVVKALVAEAERRGVLATTVNRRTAGGLTPAACAARAGAADVFRFLLAKGADPFVPDARGNTCAHHACCRRETGAYDGDSAEVAEVDRSEIGNRAEEDDARWNAEATTATDETRRARNARDVFVATLRHATRRARADHALRTMTSVDHRDAFVKKSFVKGNVLERDSRLSGESLKKKTHASSVCAGLEQLRVVRAANGDGETPAHVAARSGWACLLRFLLDRGADVLAEDARGRDVLQAACERDRPAVVALILAYVQEHGEDHGEIFDEHVSRFKNKTRVRVWSEGVTPAAVRWRALRRALPDVVSAARAGVAFDANRADVEDALELAWFARLGVLDLCGGDEDATGFARDDVSRDVVTRDASNDPALTFKNESTDAFARIDATLRAADEAFKRARRTRFANRRSRGTGDAPLHVAASEARVGAVRVLIRAGADPNLRDEGDAGDAPLHRLARSAVRRSGTANTREAADAARVLLRRGADQRAKNAAWVTPLHQAVRVGDVGLVGTLLRFAEEAEMRGMFGPSQTIWPNVPTDADADKTSRREDKAEEKTSTQTLPTLPTRQKKKGTAYELVNRASRSGATPLHSAAELGHFEIFEALLAYGAEFDARTIRGESVAHVAARLGRVAILEKLLECRETLFAPSDGASPIGTRDDVDFLVARDHTESFPIHWAAAGGHAACIAALIRAGSPVSIGGMWRGASPAHLAARADAAEALRVLVAAGADVSAQDFWTLATPLHYAAEAGAREATRVLMESHARLDAADAAGVLPENAARDATLGKTIRAFRIIGVVGVRLSGVKAKHVFYEWRALAHDARSARARDAKGTWQLVFALFAENEGERQGERLREEDESGGNVDVAAYYWLWRQWETRRRRRRRALGVGPRDAACTRAVADALETNPATAGLRHAALAWLAEASTARGASSAEEHEKRSSFFSSYVESPLGETYAKNQLVWREGTETDGTMCVVLEGAFDVFMTHEDVHGCKRESAVASLKKGATFGETALRFDGRRPTTVRARRDSSRVLRVRRRDFERAWEMEREAVERETADARARRAAARRRRRAARRVKRRETNAKRSGVSLETRDAKRLITDSSSDSSEDESVRATTVDPSALTPFELETSRDPPTHVTSSDARRETTLFAGDETDESAKKSKRTTRRLRSWEREFLATLLTAVTYDPGETLPVASQSRDDTENGDVTQQEDAYFGFVLSGELLVSTSRGGSTSGDAARTVSVDVVGAGRTYFSIAARETRDGCVFRYGADTVRVSSARGATPATVALLQGMDVAELPRSLRDLLFRRAVVHARWRPPARRVPRSTAEPESASEDSEDSDSEEDREEDRVTGDGKRETARSRNGAFDDDDRSSVVSSKHGYEEKSPAWDDRGLFPAFIEELIEAFRHVDTDRGGDIDENELKFAARALGFEPHPKRLRAMLAAMDTDGGGSVDLGEFIETVTRRVALATEPDALDAAFDAFDAARTGRISLRDVAEVARRVGDAVTSEELNALMNMGAADLDGDGQIDRAEFGEIMRARETDPAARRAAARREIKRQKDASEDAAVVVEMLGEYEDGNGKKKPRETPLRAMLRAVFDGVAASRPGFLKNPNDDVNEPLDVREIDVRDLIRALRADAEGDGSLANALRLPTRLALRRDDGTAERFETMFREMDADGSGRVDFEEFFAYFRRLKKERAAEIVASAVVRFDAIEGSGDRDDVDDDEEDATTRDPSGVVGPANERK